MEIMDENNEIDKTMMTLMDLNTKCLVEICKYLNVIDQIALQIAYPNEFNIPLSLYYQMTKSLIWDANQLDINHKFYNDLTPNIQYNFIQYISEHLEKFEITPNVSTGFDIDFIEIVIRNCQNLIEIRFLGYATKSSDDILNDGSNNGDNNLIFSPEMYYEIVENLKKLQLLELSCLFVTDEDILILTGIDILEHLILHGNVKITGKYLNQFHKLQSININPGDNLEEEHLIEILKECPDLKLIDISDSDKFNDTISECCLQNCKNLEKLFISLSDNLTFSGLEMIAQLEKLKIINLVKLIGSNEHSEKCSYLLDKMLENGLENQMEKFMTIGIGFPLMFDVLSKFTKLNTLLVRHKEDLHDDTIWEKLRCLPDLENLIVTLKLRYLNQEFFDFIENSYNISKITIIVPKSIRNDSETEVEPEIEVEPSAPEADEVFEDELAVEAVLENEEIESQTAVDTENCVEAAENEELPLGEGAANDQMKTEVTEETEEAVEELEEEKTEAAEEETEVVAEEEETEVAEEKTDAAEKETELAEEETESAKEETETETAEEAEAEIAEEPASGIDQAEEPDALKELDDAEIAEELNADATLVPTLEVDPPDFDILDESFIENLINALKNRNDSVPIKSPVELCIMLQTTLPEKDNILNDPTYVDNKSLLDLIILDK